MFLHDVHYTVMPSYVHELSVIIPHSVRFTKSLTHEMVNSIVCGVAMWNVWNFILEQHICKKYFNGEHESQVVLICGWDDWECAFWDKVVCLFEYIIEGAGVVSLMYRSRGVRGGQIHSVRILT